MEREATRAYVNQYGHLRDVQYAVYERYARKHGLTARELFVLDILWFAPEGCLQFEICQRLSATKQTISAIIKKFFKQGYVSLTESEADRRNKIVRLTDAGTEYTRRIIPPAAQAEIESMGQLPQVDMAELVRLTTLFSRLMEEKFEKIQGESK